MAEAGVGMRKLFTFRREWAMMLLPAGVEERKPSMRIELIAALVLFSAFIMVNVAFMRPSKTRYLQTRRAKSVEWDRIS